MDSSITKNKNFLLLLIGVLVIALGLLIYMQKNQPSPDTVVVTPPGQPTPKAALNHYASAQQTYEFDYPKVFTLTDSPTKNGPVELISQYYAIADFGGSGKLPGSTPLPQGMKFYFSTTLELRNLGLEAAMRKDNPNFATSYIDNKENRKVDADFMQSETLAERPAYTFNVGVEGFNNKFVYIAKDANETLVLHFQYIGDFLKDNTKPEAIAEQEQLASFNTIVHSLKFTK
jgi:hypothetical protein